MVGIFWIRSDGSIFMVRKVDMRLAQIGEDCRVDEMSHAKFWNENISEIAPELATMNYKAVPRGRVVWDDINKIHLVFLNKDFVSNLMTIAAVKKEFELKKADFYTIIIMRQFKLYPNPTT